MATRTDDTLFLPNPDDLKADVSVKDWMKKVQGILNGNQGDIKSDLDQRIDTRTSQSVQGTKTFASLKLSGSMNANQNQITSLVIENRTSDPTDPVTGQIWLRTDLI
jgi:hypothetical protein